MSTLREHFDAWTNALTGWAVKGKDKTQGNRPDQPFALDHQTLLTWWLTDKMADKVISELPKAEVANGWSFRVEGEPEASATMADELKRLGFLTAYVEARRWARLYGGAAILLLADDAQEAQAPLNEAGLRALRGLKVVDRHQLSVSKYVTDASRLDFGEPEIYGLNEDAKGGPSKGGYPVHASRLIRFVGVDVPPRARAQFDSWGESILPRLYRALGGYHQAHDAIGLILSDFSTPVYKVPKLKDLLLKSPATGPNCGETVLHRRFAAIELLRSTSRAVILDAEESFERQTTNVTGLADLVEKAEHRLVAESEMPHTLLLGDGPAGGMQSTGASEREIWHAAIKAAQASCLVPALERVMDLVMLAKEGPWRGAPPEAWTVEPNPLEQATADQEATTRLKVAQADAIYLDRGVVSAGQVAASRFAGEQGYSPDTTIDPADLAAMEQAEADGLAGELQPPGLQP